MKRILLLVTLLVIVLFSVSAIAADKVVVIPLGGSLSVAANAIYGGGRISSAGSINGSFGKSFIINRLSPGSYQITMPGYGCTTTPNWSWPSIIASRENSMGFISAFPVSCSVSSGDTFFNVKLYDAAGALMDGIFNFIITETQKTASQAASAPLADGTRDLGDCIIAPGSDAETCE